MSGMGFQIPEREPNWADGVRASFQAADEKYAAMERECEQLRALLRAVRLEANPKDYYVGYIGQMIDESGLLGSGDKGQA